MLLFREVITTPKIRHNSGTDYKYAQKIDGELKGQDSELSINLITPFHPNFENPETLIMDSMTTDELLIIMPNDVQFISDLLLFKKNEKFIRQNQQAGLDEAKSRILNEKGTQNAERFRDLKILFQSMLSDAKFTIRGENIEIRDGNIKSRIEKAFQLLIEKYTAIYPCFEISIIARQIFQNYMLMLKMECFQMELRL